jgi:N-acetylneuraminate lyase
LRHPTSIGGLIAAPFTPFDRAGAVRAEAIMAYAAHLAGSGVSGAFVCGSTGEGQLMSSAERQEVASAWRTAIDAQGLNLRLIVHVGHASQTEAARLAAHAAEIGADAIAALAPYYDRPATAEDLADFLAPVAAAAAPKPFYYYHMPAATGVLLPMRRFLPVAADRIPTLAGVKFTHEDLMDFSLCTTLDGGRFNMLWGRDEILLAGLMMGANGAVGSTYNYAAPVYQRVMAALERGDLAEARRQQLAAQRIIDCMLRHGSGKVIMKWLGIDCGPVRSPRRDASIQDDERFRREMQQLGFFDAVVAAEPVLR